jgi:hypothetical protein
MDSLSSVEFYTLDFRLMFCLVSIWLAGLGEKGALRCVVSVWDFFCIGFMYIIIIIIE